MVQLCPAASRAVAIRKIVVWPPIRARRYGHEPDAQRLTGSPWQGLSRGWSVIAASSRKSWTETPTCSWQGGAIRVAAARRARCMDPPTPSEPSSRTAWRRRPGHGRGWLHRFGHRLRR